jgi:hypothetical protein
LRSLARMYTAGFLSIAVEDNTAALAREVIDNIAAGQSQETNSIRTASLFDSVSLVKKHVIPGVRGNPERVDWMPSFEGMTRLGSHFHSCDCPEYCRMPAFAS